MLSGDPDERIDATLEIQISQLLRCARVRLKCSNRLKRYTFEFGAVNDQPSKLQRVSRSSGISAYNVPIIGQALYTAGKWRSMAGESTPEDHHESGSSDRMGDGNQTSVTARPCCGPMQALSIFLLKEQAMIASSRNIAPSECPVTDLHRNHRPQRESLAARDSFYTLK
jgi:hypothetical protein